MKLIVWYQFLNIALKIKQDINFSLNIIGIDTLYNTIKNIKSNAAGNDGINLKILELCLMVIDIYLLHIISSSCHERHFLSK